MPDPMTDYYRNFNAFLDKLTERASPVRVAEPTKGEPKAKANPEAEQGRSTPPTGATPRDFAAEMRLIWPDPTPEHADLESFPYHEDTLLDIEMAHDESVVNHDGFFSARTFVEKLRKAGYLVLYREEIGALMTRKAEG